MNVLQLPWYLPYLAGNLAGARVVQIFQKNYQILDLLESDPKSDASLFVSDLKLVVDACIYQVSYDVDLVGTCAVHAEARRLVGVALTQDAVLAHTHDLTHDHLVSSTDLHSAAKLLTHGAGSMSLPQRCSLLLCLCHS